MKKGMRLLATLLSPNKPDLKNITPVELDAIAEEVTFNYVNKLVRLRAAIAGENKTELKDDVLYTTVVKYITDLCGTFNSTRLWTGEGIRDAVWAPMMNNHDLWDFIYRGYSEFSSKVYVHTTSTSNVSRDMLVSHVADGLTGFNNKDPENSALELVPKELRDVLPRYDELEKLMNYNPWLLFIYYLSRIDLYEVIYGESDE